MRYCAIIGIVAAAISLAPWSKAVAQPLAARTASLASDQNTKLAAFKLEPASPAFQPGADAHKWQAASFAASEAEAQAIPDQSMRIAPEQRTKSAAYKWEAAFLALSAIDAAETISCVNKATCTEHNPIWGHHPSTGKIVAAKLGLGLIHFGVFKLIADRDPHTALRAAQVSAAVQGGVVLLNLHSAF